MSSYTMESSELYSADVEHSFEDCKLVIDLQDKECSRRIEDVNGEIKRRLLAREVSNLIIPPVSYRYNSLYVDSLPTFIRYCKSNLSVILIYGIW